MELERWELGYGRVWARMTAGLSHGLELACPGASALAAASPDRGRPAAGVFGLLRGPAAGLSQVGVRWRGRLVCAIDGSILCCPDPAANLA